VNLLSQTVTGAVTTAFIGGTLRLNGQPRDLKAQLNFTYGSGGTSIDVYLQTSLDGGLTWTDIAEFHVTTSSLRHGVNLTAQTPVTTQVALTDGGMAANTCQDGILGPLFRCKLLSTGTYAGGTTIAVDVQSDQIRF
jgi:hypothetical protein